MDLVEVVKWLLGLLGSLVLVCVAVVSRTFVRLEARVDELEVNKANRESTDERFERFMAQLDAHSAEDRAAINMLASKIDATNEKISALALLQAETRVEVRRASKRSNESTVEP